MLVLVERSTALSARCDELRPPKSCRSAVGTQTHFCYLWEFNCLDEFRVVDTVKHDFIFCTAVSLGALRAHAAIDVFANCLFPYIDVWIFDIFTNMDTKKFETPGDKSCSTHISDHCIGWSVLQCINNYSVFDGRIKFLIMSKK